MGICKNVQYYFCIKLVLYLIQLSLVVVLLIWLSASEDIAVSHAVKFQGTNLRNQIFNERKRSSFKVKRAAGMAEEGMQVSPQLTFGVTDAAGNSLTSSGQPTQLLIGDQVRFVITLTKDDTYSGLEVMQCTMSSSAIMPDPKAETRVLMVNGCPIQDEVTANSWYWTAESTSTSFVTKTLPVPMFRLSTSENVYLHCSMRMCFVIPSTPCLPPTWVDCLASQSKGKKRRASDVLLRYERSDPANTLTMNETLALKVVAKQIYQDDPLAVGTRNFTILIVMVSLIGVLLIVLIIILFVVLFCRPGIARRHRPQDFMEQRIVPRKKRCCACTDRCK